MGRQVRKIKPGWQHPQEGYYSDGTIRYRPLFEGPFSKKLAAWQEGQEKWSQGLVEDWAPERHNAPLKLWKPLEPQHMKFTWSEWHGECPREEDHMPEWAPGEATLFVMYEDTTEGTPISPAFESPHELARWLDHTGASAFADMSADYEYWLSVCVH